MTDIELKHRGIKDVFFVDDFRDAIQGCRRRADDFRMDMLVILLLLKFACCISHYALDKFIG